MAVTLSAALPRIYFRGEGNDDTVFKMSQGRNIFSWKVK